MVISEVLELPVGFETGVSIQEFPEVVFKNRIRRQRLAPEVETAPSQATLDWRKKMAGRSRYFLRTFIISP